MDVIDKFLTDTAPVERRDLFMSTYHQLVALGHVDHELNIENFVGVQGEVENDVIILLIENELVNACHDLALKYFIVCRKEDKLNPYNRLLEFLNYIENTIESDTVIYHHNDELDARDQFLAWVDIFRTDLSLELSDFILDVMPSLIENITEIHELKVDHTPVEYDAAFDNKVKLLKALRSYNIIDPVAMDLIRSNHLTKVETIEAVAVRFSKEVYRCGSDPTDLALHIVSLVIFTPGDMGSLCQDAKRLVNLLYDDVKLTTAITTNIDEMLNQSGALCKTMNTI